MKQRDFTRFVDGLMERREPFVVATVVRIHGSSLGKPGFKAVISREGRIVFGTIGGVCPESAIAAMAQQAIRTGQARVVKVHLEDARAALDGTLRNQSPDEVYVETNCGGMMEIYVEPYLPADRLVLIGQGGKDDVEDGLVRMGKMLGFETVVIDHLPVLTEDPDVLVTDVDYDVRSFKFAESDSVIVLTKGERDVPTLEALSKTKVRFVGMLASLQRVTDDVDQLRKRGVPQEFIESLHSPIGVDIGAITPEEVVVSVMADVVATKRGKHLPHTVFLGKVLGQRP
ncbi:MAG TPA: XdhC family protein [Nitrososphaerales archaeon]|nr:XdhC family protein [Nitrososphaerales archaeon]HUK74949.1 XdhC family protein [Nitrososphaerales archaeon]